MSKETIEQEKAEGIATFSVLGVTFETVNRLLLDGEPDAVLLYVAYASVAHWQGTYRPRATNNFMMKKLKWGKSRITSARKALEDRGIIDMVRGRDENGKLGKVYVEVRHIVSQGSSNFTTGTKNDLWIGRPVDNDTTSTLNTSVSTLNINEVHSATPKKLTPQEETTPILTKDKEPEGFSVLVSKSNQHAPAADAAEPSGNPEQLPATSNGVVEPVSNPEVFDSAAYVEMMRNDKQPHIRVIGWYFLQKDMRFPSKSALDFELKRNLRIARLVAEYFVNDTMGYREYCEKFFTTVNYEWTLETVLKKLPEIGPLSKREQK